MKKGLILVSLTLAALSVACNGDKAVAPPIPDAPHQRPTMSRVALIDSVRAAEVVPLHKINVSTYDSSGESNHPDYLYRDEPWAFGKKLLYVDTPYRHSFSSYENPSLRVGDDLDHLFLPPGLKDPLVPQNPAGGYNSDPELVWGPDRRCVGVIFRYVNTENNIEEIHSCDLLNWSEPRVLFSEPNHRAVSPTVADAPDGSRLMFYVDAGLAGCSASSTEIKVRKVTSSSASLGEQNYGPASSVPLSQDGLVIWHIKARYIPSKGEWWFLYAAYSYSLGDDCLRSDLYFARSSDLKNWQTYPLPIVSRFDTRFNFISVYRASFDYNPSTDGFRVAVSAIDSAGRWGQHSVTFEYSRLLRVLELTRGVTIASLRASLPTPQVHSGVDLERLVEDR